MKNAILTMTTAATVLCLSAAVQAGVRVSPHDAPFIPKVVPGTQTVVRVSVLKGKNMPLVRAKLDGRDCTLLFDTGATHTTIDIAFVRRELPDAKLEKVALGGMTNVEGAPMLFPAASLKLGDAEFRDFDVMALDLSGLGPGIGTPVDGIVGMNVIGATPFLLSLGEGRAVFRPDETERAGFKEGIARYADDAMSVAMTPVYGGKMFGLIVDSAASLTFLDKSLGWPSTGEREEIGAVGVNGDSGIGCERGKRGGLVLGIEVEIEPRLVPQRVNCIGADALLRYDMLVDTECVRFRPCRATGRPRLAH